MNSRSEEQLGDISCKSAKRLITKKGVQAVVSLLPDHMLQERSVRPNPVPLHIRVSLDTADRARGNTMPAFSVDTHAFDSK